MIFELSFQAKLLNIVRKDYSLCMYCKPYQEVIFNFTYKKLYEIILDYHEMYKQVITFTAFQNEIIKRFNQGTFRKEELDLISRSLTIIFSGLEDELYIRSNITRFIEYKVMKSNLLKAQEELENNNISEVKSCLNDALSFHIDDKNVLQDISNYDFLNVSTKRGDFPFGLKRLDELTGGVSRRELSMILAWTGIGKSTFAIHCSIRMLYNKKRVLYITTELPEEQIYKRFIGGLTENDYRELYKNTNITVKIREVLDKYKDQLFIKRIEPNIGTPSDIASLLAHIEQRGTPIDLVVLDPFDLLGFDKQRRELRFSIRESLYSLLNIVERFNTAFLFTTQSNTKGVNQRQIFTHYASESVEKSRVASLVLGLGCNEADHSLGRRFISISKQRDGQTGPSIPYLFDFKIQLIKEDYNI